MNLSKRYQRQPCLTDAEMLRKSVSDLRDPVADLAVEIVDLIHRSRDLEIPWNDQEMSAEVESMIRAQHDALVAQRDELREALRGLLYANNVEGGPAQALANARAALRKAGA